MYQQRIYFHKGDMMQLETKIQKWGNGLALRVAGMMREIPSFEEGTPVNIFITEDGFTVKKVKSKPSKKLPFSEAHLLRGLNAKTVHADELADLLDSEII